MKTVNEESFARIILDRAPSASGPRIFNGRKDRLQHGHFARSQITKRIGETHERVNWRRMVERKQEFPTEAALKQERFAVVCLPEFGERSRCGTEGCVGK